MSTTRFRPIRGLESILKNQAIVDGNVYFATDTGKIFLDAQGTRNLMGGSGTSVIYAQASSIYNHPNGNFIMQTSDLSDDNYLPRVDDLIINSDGRFFKVISANSSTITCKLLAVSGTGGGGGGSFPGGSTPGDGEIDERVISVRWHDIKYNFIAGKPYYISFTATSAVDKYLNVEYQVQTETAIVETKVIQIESGKVVNLEVGSKMATSGANAVHFSISGANSRTFTQSFTNIKSIDFKLEQDTKNFTNYELKTGTKFYYYVNAYGSIEKTLMIDIDNGAWTSQVNLSKSPEMNKAIEINCSSLAPGVHTITAYLMAEGLPSNTIVTDFIYHPEGTPDATYILVSQYPAEIFSYESPIVNYWVYNTAQSDGGVNEVVITVNNEKRDPIYPTQVLGQGLIYPLGRLQSGKNICTLSSGNAVPRSFEINVVASDIFDPVTDSAMLLLSSEGRSNSVSLERRLNWSYNNIAANLKNFNWYNNGWMLDDNNRSCLRISNGASVEIPLTLFTNSQPTVGGCTVEFELKPYNLYSYELLAAATESSGEDDQVSITRVFDPTKAIIKYLQGSGANAYGFCIGTQDAYFRLSDGTNVTARYKDEEMLNIAISIDASSAQMSIYINGVMSGMTGYLRSSGEMPLYANLLEINSDYCDIDLYNIRIYSGKALSSDEIVKNYVSSKKDLDIYEQNRLSAGKAINLADLIEYNKNNPDKATIPYAIIKTQAPDILPYVKVEDDDDAIKVEIDFVNPALDYKFSLGQYTEDEYLHKIPSFNAKNVIFNVQGTSSQKYPRKNFKAKFKKSTITYTHEKVSEEKKVSTNQKLYLDSSIGEKAFTWKADYMDSSGCHNTGFASFVQLLYKNHPLDYYENTEGVYNKQYRTTIYGFPMLVFHQKSDGTISFVGKYNFNHDKGCDDTLGFTHDGVNKILNQPYEDVAECWEFGNNQGGRCSFRGAPFDEGYDYITKTGKLTSLGEDLEVRYHVNADAIEQAFKNLAEDEKTPITDEQAFNILLGGTGAGNHPHGYGNLEKLFLWLQSVDFVTETDSSEKARKKQKFISEFTRHFNLEYCLVYYIMTDLLIQYDSRGKNMMLGTWGPMEEYWQNDEGDYILDESGEKIRGEYIWFPLYYDIDTQLGVDNSGVPSWEYNVEPSNEAFFSTANSILWTCFKEGFEDAIKNKYRELRQGNLKIEKINGYYEFNPEVSGSDAMRGILPISFINADQYYKYIAPAVSGYDGLDQENKLSTLYTSGYYYCLQGTRELHRALFLRNRFNYYDSMWRAMGYDPTSSGSAMRTRIDERLDQGVLNTKEEITLTPKLDQYLCVWMDQSASKMISVKGTAGQPTTLYLDPENTNYSNYDAQLMYIGGPGNLLDFGDLSLLYINELDSDNGFPTSSVRSIVLGNEHPNYSNERLIFDQVKTINGKTEAGVLTAPKSLLQVYDLTNLSTLNGTLPIDTANKLETFKALGTRITNVQFAEGVALKRVYLPETTNKLELIEAYNLNKIVYNYSDILDDEGKQTKDGLYIQNVIHTTNDIQATHINNIKIIGGALDLYSYDLLSKLTNAKIEMRNYGSSLTGYENTLGIHLENVHWSPYTQLGEGAIYDEAKSEKYKCAENNFTYNNYIYDVNTWEKLLAEGRIYEYDSSKINQTPTNLDLLDAYIDQTNGQQFTNITTTLQKGLPIITGDMFINNTTSISEYDIATKYKTAFPNLNIRVANVDEAYRARFIEIDENGREKELFAYRYNSITDTITPPLESTLSLPSHYDFDGWIWYNHGETKYKTTEEFATFSFADQDEYVFVLQMSLHEYNITFKDGDNTEYVVPILYNSAITAPSIVPYKPDDTNLNYNEVYRFKGWTNDSSYHGVVSEIMANNVIINLANEKAIKDTTYYAVFIKDSVYNNILDATYFNITPDSAYIDEDDDTYGYTSRCATITLKSGYNSKLKGKITIPTWITDPSNPGMEIPVVAVGGFMDSANITHCFFDNHKEFHIKKILVSGFERCLALRFIELPPSLRFISNKAFYDCDQLAMTPGNEHDLRVDGNVYYVGSQALSGLTAATMTTNIFIGSKVKYIEDAAFAYSNRILGALTFGTATQPTEITRIVSDAFKTNGGRQYTELIMYCQDINHKIQLETLINNTAIPYKTVSYPYSNS